MGIDANKISAAKLWLIGSPAAARDADAPRGLAYLGRALYALTVVESSAVTRMTCDEYWRVYVNPEWLDAADLRDVASELAHMTWHLLLDHAARARGMRVDRSTATSWGTASDLPVGQALAGEELRPPGLPTPAERRLPPGKSAEEYFAMISGLPAAEDAPGQGETPEGCGSGGDGIPRSHDLGAGIDLAGVTEMEARSIRERVAIEYREHRSQRGDEPWDALRWVEEVLAPRVSWQQVLATSVRRAIGWTAGRGEYTYSRPARRSGSTPGILLPGQHRRVPRVAIVVDTSASVDDELLATALGEIDGVIAALGVVASQVTVYSVDAAVHATTNLRSAKDAKLIGAGGTDLRVGLEAIRDQRPRPDLALVLTDGDTPWPESPPPGTVVIVGLLGRRGGDALPPTPDWAIRVECLADPR